MVHKSSGTPILLPLVSQRLLPWMVKGCHIPKLLKFAAGKSCVQICIAFVHSLPVSFICWDWPNGRDSSEFYVWGIVFEFVVWTLVLLRFMVA